jgi:hypothetical protein
MQMKKKNRKTERPLEILGYLTTIMVWPLKRAERVMAKQMHKMARDMRTRAQKKTKVPPDLGSSLETTGLPEMRDKMFWMR